MDDLTPEAVRAALDGATPGPWRPHCDEDGYTGEIRGALDSDYDGCIADWVDGGNADLIAMAPALARDWLRLKKVEEAAQWVKKNPFAHPDLVRRIICDAVEGK